MNKPTPSDRMLAFKKECPYFDEQKIAKFPESKYVAWLDVMGSASAMSRSMSIAANFLGKLHDAALRSERKVDDSALRIYPFNDGIYITSSKQWHFLRLIKEILRMLALSFIFEKNPYHHFIARACISFGPIWEGDQLLRGSHTLENNEDYSRYILLGPPVSQAYRDERKAAPFGVWIHESARSFGPVGAKNLTHTHWHWWTFKPDESDSDIHIALELKEHLEAYFHWCKENSTYLEHYTEENISGHLKLMQQYFGQLSYQPIRLTQTLASVPTSKDKASGIPPERPDDELPRATDGNL